ENRSRQSVLSRQPGLGVRAAGAPRSRRSAPDGGGGSAAEELGRPGSSGRPASEAASARRRDRGVAARARRRRRGDRPWQDREEDKRGTGAAEEMKAGGTRQKATASGWLAAFCLFPFAFCLFACTPKPPALPAGAASPFPEYQQAWTEATRECAGVQTLRASLDLDDGTAFLRQANARWRIAAASSPHMTVRYDLDRDGRPSTIRIFTDASTTAADLTLRVSQVDINVTLTPRTFTVDVPRDAAPITLDELRRAGPLGR